MPAKRTIVGLDIGRAVVKAAWAESRGGVPRVVRTESLKLPPGVLDTRGVLLPWLEQQRIAQYPCVVGIPGDKAMFQPFMLPPGDPRSLDDAANMETVKFNEMASETMVYGFTPIELNPGEKRLLLAMARPSVLSQYLSLQKEAGLNIVDAVPTPAALFRALHTANGAAGEGVTLYLGLGHSATDLAIAGSQSGLLFARAFASGGQVFTDRLAREGRLAGAVAEAAKIERGSLLPDADTAPALRQAADQWLTEVESCLSVYRNLFRGRNTEIARVVLCGGAAALPGLAAYTAAKLGLQQVALASELKDRQGLQAPMTFATAAGLALCGLDPDGTHISLLPADMRDELMFRRQKPHWIGSAVIAALILAVSLAGGLYVYRRQSADLRGQKASLKRRQDLVTEIERIHARSSQILQMAAPVERMAKGGPALRRLISLVGEKKSARDRITLICDADSYFFDEDLAPVDTRTMGMRERKRREQMETSRMSNAGISNAVIRGYTRESSLTTVKQLITDLRAADFVANADLLSDDKLVGEQAMETNVWRRGRPFVIEVSLAPP